MSAGSYPSLTTSLPKFLLLNTVTFGIYTVYLGWKYWEIVKQAAKDDLLSTVRGFFVVVTSFWLFPKVLKLAKSEGYTKSFNSKMLAFLFLALYFLTNFGSMDSNFPLALMALQIVAFIALSGLILYPVMQAMNFYVAHTDDELEIGTNWLLIGICVGLIILVALLSALFVPVS